MRAPRRVSPWLLTLAAVAAGHCDPRWARPEYFGRWVQPLTGCRVKVPKES